MPNELTIDGSILDTIKKKLGISPTDDSFDVDITICINTAFERLETLGIGPKEGFRITDNTTKWTEYLTNNKVLIDSVKDYIYMKVKLMFDTSTSSSFLIDSFKKQIDEMEFIFVCKSDQFDNNTDHYSVIIIVDSYDKLPQPGADGVLYLIPNHSAGSSRYDEYIWIDEINDYEKIGSEDIDMSEYVKHKDITKVNQSEIEQLVDEAYDQVFNN